MVIMLQGENARDVARAGEGEGRRDRARRCPRACAIVPFYDQSEVIDRTSHGRAQNLLEGSLLVIVVLFFFLRDLRASLIVAAVIPLSMLAGFIGMRLFGVSANLMSLGAIDFGLIVDGAVVMMENFVRRRARTGHRAGARHRPTRACGTPDLFRSAAVEVARPVLFGVLIIIAVYLPIFTLEGLEGKMFRPMAITVCSALLGSLLLSLTAVPVAAVPAEARRPPSRGPLVRAAEGALLLGHLADAMNHRPAHARRWRSPSSSWRSRRSRSSAPSSCRASTRGRSSSRRASCRRSRSRSRCASRPASSGSPGRVPRGEAGRDEDGPARPGHRGDGHLPGRRLREPPPERRVESGRSKEELIDAMAAALAELPGVSTSFTQPMAMRLDEVVSGVKADVAVKIFGPDSRCSSGSARRSSTSRDVEGAADLQVEALSGRRAARDPTSTAPDCALRAERRRRARGRRGGRRRHRRPPSCSTAPGASRSSCACRTPCARPRGDRRSCWWRPGGERCRSARWPPSHWPPPRRRSPRERRSGGRRADNVRGRDVGSFVAEAQQARRRRADAGRLLPRVGRAVREPGSAPPRGWRSWCRSRSSSSSCCCPVTFGRVRWALLIL
jgi:heavy metal efflux system protein